MRRPPEIVIEAGRTERHYWRDLWRFRDLFVLLTWRDILVRYKQTVLGASWAILKPLLTALVFTIVFGLLAKLPSDGVPYPLLVACALLPWQFFATAISDASNSLTGNAGMISKVYFPRLLIPASAVTVGLIDMLASGLVLVGMMAWYGVAPNWRILALPLFAGLAFAMAMGAGLWFAALNVKYRDVRFLVPFVVQFGLYLSPVGFSSLLVPEGWRAVYALNPMVGVIEGFRWALLGTDKPIYWTGMAISFGFALTLTASGVWFFRHTEKSFADII